MGDNLPFFNRIHLLPSRDPCIWQVALLCGSEMDGSAKLLFLDKSLKQELNYPGHWRGLGIKQKWREESVTAKNLGYEIYLFLQ